MSDTVNKMPTDERPRKRRIPPTEVPPPTIILLSGVHSERDEA